MSGEVLIPRQLAQEVQLLCEWIAETPHQRGSINGRAAQVLYAISQAPAAPITPEFTGVALRKLTSLQADDWVVNGVHIQREADGSYRHGAVTAQGMVLWWRGKLDDAALAPQPAQEPVAWKHDCAALLQNDVELWVDRCPHCGKPRATPQAPQPAPENTPEGCTPADARMLRAANHQLAQELHELKAAQPGAERLQDLRKLLSDINDLMTFGGATLTETQDAVLYAALKTLFGE